MDKQKKGLILGFSIMAAIIVILAGTLIYVSQASKTPETVCQPTDSNHIRIATFNLAAYDHPKMKKVNQQLEAYAIDVVGFQEVDKFTKRNKRDLMQDLAECENYPYVDFQKRFDYQGGEYGIGMASNMEIAKRSGGLFAQAGETEVCAWEMISVQKGSRVVHIYNTHFDWLNKEKRRAQICEMVEILNSDSCPYKILTGDFNTDQDYRECDPFLKNYNITNGYNGNWVDTYNEEDENMKVYAIDNIVTTRNLRLVKSEAVKNSKLSDHSMLYAEFEFLDEKMPSRQLLESYIADAQALASSDPEVRGALILARHLREDASQVEINLAVEALERALED